MLVVNGNITVKLPFFHTISPGSLPKKGSLFTSNIPKPNNTIAQPKVIMVLANEL